MNLPNFTGLVQVPCKALLFGEYGLLCGLGAPVYVSMHHKFLIRLEVVKSKIDSDHAQPVGCFDLSCRIHSSFFEHKFINLAPNECDLFLSKSLNIDLLSRDQKFFLSLLAPYAKVLVGCHLNITILDSYSPHLGLGSSSALLAGVHALLDSYLKSKSITVSGTTYGRILESLKYQGSKGSGYDALVQHMSVNSIGPKLFWVSADAQQVRSSVICFSAVLGQWSKQLLQSKCGLCVLDSGVYSDTQAVIGKQSPTDLWTKHGELAEGWRKQEFKLSALPDLMERSLLLGQEQGLLANDRYTQTLRNMTNRKLAAKTMGAGLGDGWLVYGPNIKFQDVGESVSLPIGQEIIDFAPQALPLRLQQMHERLFSARLAGQINLQPGDLGACSAPSNIALTKYWGKQPDQLQIPLNSSLSLTLGGFRSFTKLEVVTGTWPWDQRVALGENQPKSKHKFFWAKDQQAQLPDKKLQAFLDRFLSQIFPDVTLMIRTHNNFPTACGIASSASGFAALVGALADLLNLKKFFTAEEIEYWCTQWARIGSGSALRSALPFSPSSARKKQFVAWQVSLSDPLQTTAQSIFAAGAMQTVASCVVVLDDVAKQVSSSDGHASVQSSPFFPLRIACMKARQSLLEKAIATGDFASVAEISERDAFEMHALMQTSVPPAVYFSQKTSTFIQKFIEFRNETGCLAFWTLDAGPNVHLIVQEAHVSLVKDFMNSFSRLQFALKVLWNQCDEGLKIGLGYQDFAEGLQEETYSGSLN